MNKTVQRTNMKKQNIVEASLRLFKRSGFSKTSIQEIAKEASVSQVTIYNYYGNKDALIQEVVAYLLKGLAQECEAIINEQVSFEEKIHKLIHLCNDDVYQTMNAHFDEAIQKDEKLYRLLFNSNLSYLREIMRNIIEVGKKEHAIDTSIETDVILDLIDACRYLQAHKYQEDRKQYNNQLQQILLHGICLK